MIEIEKPNIVTLNMSENGEQATFVVEPLERGYGITLGLGTAGQHHIREDGISSDFLRHHRSHTTGTDN